MKFKSISGNIFVRARVNGFPGWMMVDTGCSSTSLDMMFSRKLGLKAVGHGRGHDATSKIGKIPIIPIDAIEVGPILLEKLQCAVIDYGHLKKVLKIDFIGILGSELFQDRLVLLDLNRRHLTQTKTVPISFRWHLAILGFVHNIPVVEVKVDRWKILAVVDTGNAKIPVVICSRRISEALLRRYQPIGKTRQSGATGEKELKATKISCPVGFSNFELLRADVVCRGSIAAFGSRVRALIGLPLFMGHRVIFDYKRRLIHIEP